jgi:hypothetical protein
MTKHYALNVVLSISLLCLLAGTAAGQNVLDFDGSNDFVTVESFAANTFMANDNTVEFWFRASGGTGTFVDVHPKVAATRAAKYVMSINSAGRIIASHQPWDSGISRYDSISVSTTAGGYDDGNWHHVAFVYEHNVKMSLYVDGVFIDQDSIVGVGDTYAAVSLELGTFMYVDPGGTRDRRSFLNGQLYDVRVWEKALSAAEIAANMNSGYTGTETDLRAWYTLDQGVGGGTSTSTTSVIDSESSLNGVPVNFRMSGTESNFVGFVGDDPSLTLADRVKTVGSPDFAMVATSESGGAITYASSDTGVATIDSSSGTVTLIAAGAATITATQTSATSYASDTATATLTVKSSNAEPAALSLPGTLTLVEDTAGNLDFSALTLSDADDDPLVLRVTVSAGTLSTPAASSGLTTALISSTELTLSGSVANLNTYLDTASNLQYTGAVNSSGSAAATVTLKADDDTVETTLGTVSIDITAVNDAPVLDATETPTLGTILRNAGDDDGSGAEPDDDALNNTNNPGVSVASLVVDASVTDVDGSAIEAIAVTAADNTNGVWQYSLDNGGSWNVFSGTTGASVNLTTAARLLDGTLSGGTTHKIRFVPDINYDGSAAITFRAWDKSAGTAGDTSDASTTGGSSAFSATSDTAATTVSGGNTLPVLSGVPASQTFTEDTSGNLNLGAVAFSDPDSDVLTLTLTLSAGSFGTLGSGTGITAAVVSATEVTLTGTASALTTHLDSAAAVPFVLPANANGTPYATLSLSVTDGTATAADSMVLNVTAVNDAPTGENLPFWGDAFLTSAGDDDGDGADGDDDATDNSNNQGITIADLLVFAEANDVDGGDLGVAVIEVSNPSGGTGSWEYSTDNGASWTAFANARGTTSIETAARLLDGAGTGASTSRIRFNPNGSTTTFMSLRFVVWDKSSGTAGATADATTKGGSTAFSTSRPLYTLSTLSAGSPLIANLFDDKAVFYPGSSGTLIDVGRDAVFSDDTTSYDTVALQFQLHTGYKAAEDIIEFASDLGVTLAGNSAGDNVLIGGTVVGTLGFTLPSSFLKVTLNSAATEADVTTLIRSVLFRNTNTSTRFTSNRTVITTVSGPTGSLRTNSRVMFGTSDADATLAAAGGVAEPVAIATTVDTAGEAVDVFDFTLSDGGSGDGLALEVSQVVINVSGTTTDTQRDNITWRLSGPDASGVTGTYNAAADTLTFPSLTISVADGASEVYTVSAYYDDNSGVTDNATIILSVDGDTDLTTSGTAMGTTTAVTNGAGSAATVTATKLVFSQ